MLNPPLGPSTGLQKINLPVVRFTYDVGFVCKIGVAYVTSYTEKNISSNHCEGSIKPSRNSMPSRKLQPHMKYIKKLILEIYGDVDSHI